MDMYNTSSELYNALLEICLMNTMIFQVLNKKDGPKYNLVSLIIDTHDYTEWLLKKMKNHLIHHPCHL